MNTKNLLIIGAGQYGQVVKETAEAIGCFQQIQFLDDNSPAAIGKLNEFKLFSDEYHCAFVAIGNPQVRKFWLDRLEQAGFELPILIHPGAYVAPSAKLEKATILEPMAVVNAGAVVERGCLLCAGSVINHNACVMSVCQIDCNATVASNALVPEGTKVFSGTVYERK